MVGVRRGTGRIRTGPRGWWDSAPMENGRAGGGGERRGWQRARTERTSLGPEDRPSKLSHALSVLRKRRIGVAVLRCFLKERGSEEERVGERGCRRRSVHKKEVTEEDRGWKEILS